MDSDAYEFACPLCGGPLEARSPVERYCPVDKRSYECVDGIWRFLPPERAAQLERFMREYETIRAAEERGAPAAPYYRALPYVDLTARFSNDWKIRARGYDALVERVIAPPERSGKHLRILDLGAGNGWLSNRLSERGHTLAAVDLGTGTRDGLGARMFYETTFTCVQADFDCLPFAAGQIDLAIFNSSFHYSVRYEASLEAALRTLNPGGQVVILDTPIYHDCQSGAQMVQERQAHFERAYGLSSNARTSEDYMTYDRLDALGEHLDVEWQTYRPFRGVRWALRPIEARVRGGREPAEFLLIVGRRKRSR